MIRSAAIVAALAMLVACGDEPDNSAVDTARLAPKPMPVAALSSGNASDKPALGLMTSLPLFWPLGTDVGTLASGRALVTWQREALEREYAVQMLDTLSPMKGLTPDAPDIDPLADLNRLAVIQPRGLSPADNVALDDWVREGGELLLMLDPALTGHYDVPLGDPRRPNDTALIPPVVARWGLKVVFDEGQPISREVALENATLPISLAGEVRLTQGGGAGADCTILGDGVAAQCIYGKGRLTLLADAFAFEATGHSNPADHADDHGENEDHASEDAIIDVLHFAFGG